MQKITSNKVTLKLLMVGKLNSINKLNKRVRKLITKWITAEISKMRDLIKMIRATRIVSGCVWASAPILLQLCYNKHSRNLI